MIFIFWIQVAHIEPHPSGCHSVPTLSLQNALRSITFVSCTDRAANNKTAAFGLRLTRVMATATTGASEDTARDLQKSTVRHGLAVCPAADPLNVRAPLRLPLYCCGGGAARRAVGWGTLLAWPVQSSSVRPASLSRSVCPVKTASPCSR